MNDLFSMVDLVVDCGVDTWNMLQSTMGVFFLNGYFEVSDVSVYFSNFCVGNQFDVFVF